MIVFLSEKAYKSLFSECNAYIDSKLETGGVLLGVIDNEGYYIIENILPGSNAKHGKYSFEYDASYINNEVTRVNSKHRINLEVLGLWHTHWEGLPLFSITDMELNIKYTKAFERDIISILVIGCQEIELFAYKIDCEGNIQLLPLKTGDEYIPAQYMDVCDM